MRQAILILACAAAIAAGWGAYRYAYQGPTLPGSADAPALEFGAAAGADDLGPLEAPRQAPQGYKEYYDAQYRFSVFYPDDLSVGKRDEGGGASTITFQNPQTAKGFQVFVVPYAGTSISEERFLKDVPSGVRTELQSITIDGAAGAAFYSKHQVLGETAEVWLLRGGYLYEVTTLKPLAGWLSEIMQTWHFI